MNRNRLKKHEIYDMTDRRLLAVYIIWEILNFAAIQYASFCLADRIQWRIMYTAIAVNTLMTLYFYLKYGRKHRSRSRILVLALLLTGLADYFLTLHNIVMPGYILFCLVETLYAIYFKPSGKNVLVRIFFYILCLALAGKAGLLTVANAFGILNMTLIAGNVISALFMYLHEKNSHSFWLAVGFVLFFGCDSSILVRTLSRGTIEYLAHHMIWTFYGPAQLILTLTCIYITLIEI